VFEEFEMSEEFEELYPQQIKPETLQTRDSSNPSNKRN
jgi:hypothetical protein